MVCEINGLPPFPSVKDALEEPSSITKDELEKNEEKNGASVFLFQKYDKF